MVRKIKPHAPRAEENRHPEKPLCVLVGRPLGPDSLEVESITEISTIKGNRQVLPGAAASKLFFRVAVRSKAALTVSTAIASAARSIPSYLLAPAAIADHGRFLRLGHVVTLRQGPVAGTVCPCPGAAVPVAK
jgi:hypothetical protein